jgi:trans-L-3-hydroxyproline dehydratase
MPGRVQPGAGRAIFRIESASGRCYDSANMAQRSDEDGAGRPGVALTIATLEAHAAGEPLRIILSGFPEFPGATILEKRRYLQKNLDHLRTALMWEPRGHADMYGCLLTEPVNPGSHLGVLFMHNEGYSSMCGHGVIALTTAVFERGLMGVPRDLPVLRLDTPAGLVEAVPHWEGEKIASVSFLNVPSFVYALDHRVEVPGIGPVACDVAFGGAFYAFCRAEDLGVRLVPEDFRKLIDLGMRVKRAVMASLPIRHPFETDLGFLYGTIIMGPARAAGHFGRNVCVFAEGEVDRSPTGTGVSARAALHVARGEIGLGEPFVVESLLGTTFTGRAVRRLAFGPHDAVIPEVSGSAHLTGTCEFLIDPADPLRHGFILR